MNNDQEREGITHAPRTQLRYTTLRPNYLR